MKNSFFFAIIFGMTVEGFAGAGRQGLYPMNQRFGVSYSYQKTQKNISSYPYSSLGSIGWYSDGEADYVGCSGSVTVDDDWRIDRVPVVAKDSLPPAPDAVQTLFQRYPHTSVWQISSLLGIDCYTLQPNNPTPPAYRTDQYARDFKAWSDQINQIDPTFKVMAGGVGLGTLNPNNRNNFSFLKETIKDYYQWTGEPMPIDIFNLQIILGSHVIDPFDTFKDTIYTFRQWMSSVELSNGIFHDYSDSELWITYGVADTQLFESQVVDFLGQSMQWLMSAEPLFNFDLSLGMDRDQNRLVQSWAWYSVYDPSLQFRRSTLFDHRGELTVLGSAYGDLVPHHIPEPETILLLVLSAVFYPPIRRTIRL